MKTIPMFTHALQSAVDLLYALWPQPVPEKDRLISCKIISHRGEHDNHHIVENTLGAFDRVMDAGVWGIELDLRWTKDLHPIVFHDATLQRLFHDHTSINHMSLSELQNQYPMIPSLETVIEKYGRKMHLMIEIKKERYPDPVYQHHLLERLLSPLVPQTDFHLLSLHPEMLDYMDFIPKAACILISEVNTRQISSIAIEKRFGGMAGHFLLLTGKYLNTHWQAYQVVGSGFIRSKNCLYRELNRGIEWIFTNHAIRLQSVVNSTLAELDSNR